jgi:hypothetical protein
MKKKIMILASMMKNQGILCLMIKLRAVNKMKMMNRLNFGLNKKRYILYYVERFE